MRNYLARVRVYQWVAPVALVAFVMLSPATADAQSGSKPAGSDAKQAGSGAKAGGSSTKADAVAMEGYCPVCIIEMKKWMAGNASFKSTYDGRTYLFPGQDQKAMFDANPSKYAPALGGDCIVAFKKMGKRVPGNIRQAAFHNKRLFMFSNEKAKKEFLANKEMYASADVALGGKCTVCKIEMSKDVDGKMEFAANHKGMLYLFPGTKQRDMFNANPAKYAVSTMAGQAQGSAPKGSAPKGSAPKGSGGK